ncbi:hypothetical protein ACTFIV_006919, partial [Dictyostelium citrinum]
MWKDYILTNSETILKVGVDLVKKTSECSFITGLDTKVPCTYDILSLSAAPEKIPSKFASNVELTKIRLTSDQKEIVIGTMMGDSHIKTKTNYRTASLVIHHSGTQKEYFKHKYDIFQNIIKQQIDFEQPKNITKKSPNGSFLVAT